MSNISNYSSTLIEYYLQYPLTYLSVSDLYPYEIFILVIYGIMIIFSFFTNAIAIVIFSVGRRSRSELSPFLLNLSISNIIMTVYCIPFTITSVIFQRWLYAPALCTILDALKTFSVSGVLLTLIAIAIDRYCAVKYPLAIKLYSVHKRNTIALTIIWLLSIVLAILWSPARSMPMTQTRLWVNSRSLFKQFLDAVENHNDTSIADQIREQFDYRIVETIQCVRKAADRPIEVQRTILNFLQTYFVPLFVLAFVYLRIATILWHRSNRRRSSTGGGDNRRTSVRYDLSAHESVSFKKKLKKGIKMLVVVVGLYAILWLPMNVFQLLLNILCDPSSKYQKFCHDATLLQLLYIAAHFLTVSNTAINPIIYGFANHRFRGDIQQMRHRLLNLQNRSPFYYRTKLVNPPGRQSNGHLRVDANGNINQNLLRSSTRSNFKGPLTLTSNVKTPSRAV